MLHKKTLSKLNHLVIVGVAVLMQVIGFVWYGFLFQEAWLFGANLTLKDIDPNNYTPYFVSVASSVAIAYGLAILLNLTKVSSVTRGIKVALGAFFAFFFFSLWQNYAFSLRPDILLMVDAGYSFVIYIVAGAILAEYRNKK